MQSDGSTSPIRHSLLPTYVSSHRPFVRAATQTQATNIQHPTCLGKIYSNGGISNGMISQVYPVQRVSSESAANFYWHVQTDYFFGPSGHLGLGNEQRQEKEIPCMDLGFPPSAPHSVQGI